MPEENVLSEDEGKFTHKLVHPSTVYVYPELSSRDSPQPSTSQAYNVPALAAMEQQVFKSRFDEAPEPLTKETEQEQGGLLQNIKETERCSKEEEMDHGEEFLSKLSSESDQNDFTSKLSVDDREDRCSSAERSILGSAYDVQAVNGVVPKSNNSRAMNTPDIDEAIVEIICD